MKSSCYFVFNNSGTSELKFLLNSLLQLTTELKMLLNCHPLGLSLSLMLRPTVSRPVYLGIRNPSGAYDQISFIV
jgi:hypothetical protein